MRETKLLIAFEGPDGSGKTTLAKLLAQRTGSAYTLSIPDELALLRGEADALSDWDCFSFYATCNAIQMKRLNDRQVRENIVVDRYVLSTATYHGVILGESLDDYLTRFLSEPLYGHPDLVVYVTASLDSRKARAQAQGTVNKWFEVTRGDRLHQEYLRLLKLTSLRHITIDTTHKSTDQAYDELVAKIMNSPAAGLFATRDDGTEDI